MSGCPGGDTGETAGGKANKGDAMSSGIMGLGWGDRPIIIGGSAVACLWAAARRWCAPVMRIGWMVALLVGAGGGLAPPAAAAPPGPEAFQMLDAVPDWMARCAEADAEALESDDPTRALAAMIRENACLRGIVVYLAETFYAPEMFGAAGPGALLDQVSEPLDRLFSVLQTQPLACAPVCNEFYEIQAKDMTRRFLTTLILDMTERLKDDSPVHIE